ncbi:MAG: glycosyltransferase [Defluviitaleaceae bacterium]|nr:glycosyltransferase [Defluviitaleaceae bacterium]
MVLSVIIPTYINKIRSPDRLLLTITGYLHQKLDKELYEVIIVNDGSKFEIEEHIYKNIKDLENIRIENKQHTGMCSSLNYGVSLAKGEYVLIGVDDNIPSYDCLYNLYVAIDSDKGNSQSIYIGKEYFLFHVTGMKDIIECTYFRGINENSYKERYKEELSIFPNISLRDIETRYNELLYVAKEEDSHKQFANFLDNKSLINYHWLCLRPGALVMKTIIYNELEGFDEKFDPSGWYSDLEFGYRLSKKGIKMRYLNDFTMIHLNHMRIDCNPKVENQCFEYLINKYNNVDMYMLPFIWFDSKLETYVNHVERVKKHIKLTGERD